jgi:hypothetical protein
VGESVLSLIGFSIGTTKGNNRSIYYSRAKCLQQGREKVIPAPPTA